ncbi:hypothetical protein [Arthrobacter sp. ISL-69]|uniref:hypothetical protein n=1 Tax=Arthrobacter sp. ISL-69 TaxID=2819113 RepID=UPI001BE7637E|nr:hypothetical protein [Arthrobacter sp. ISL-69]MBT2537242.1 hypothetical protein [Arthrobacter sp. ISL-69]
MSAMTLMGEQTGVESYEVTATPDYGNRIRLKVAKGAYSAGYSNRTGYIVMTANGGTISAHRTFERAVSEAITRAKRYVAAYSKPRGRAA